MIDFLDPVFLWLLAVPALGVLAWLRQLLRRRRDIRRYSGDRVLPVRERFSLTGDLAFWLCLTAAVTCLVLALARPQGVVNRVMTAGVDFVVLQDGSTSMRVSDVAPDRWQRSTAWLRTFAETLSWTDERLALALFAFRPAPQVRLTSDPNAFFFFLDHLGEAPPFRLEDDTSWDTNIEEGIFWGVKMIEVDEELYGRRRSAKAFVVVSDGQAWSGEVGKALELARSRGIRVYVVGVGTSAGGAIPDVPPRRYEPAPPVIHSALDRRSLRAIAAAGGGRYYELGTQSDQLVALQILADAQQFAQQTHREDVVQELYWSFLLAAAGFVGLGTLVIRERVQLWWQLAAVTGLLVAMALGIEMTSAL